MFAKTIAVINQKGGVGKTTTTVNIGSILANQFSKKILLVDIDPQGNMSDHIGLDPNNTDLSVYDLLVDNIEPTNIIKNVYNLDALPANLHLSGAEVELATLEDREKKLKNQLGKLKNFYNYIFLDCPPSLGLLTLSALVSADEVIIPMEAEYLALRGVSQLIQTIELVRKTLNPNLIVSGVIFCKFDGRTTLARDVKAEIDNYFPGKVYATAVRKNIRLAEAPSRGMPINIYDPNCPGSIDYQEITKEFLQRHNDLTN